MKQWVRRFRLGSMTAAAALGSVISASAAEPINPNTIQEARNVLNYVYSVYGTRILAGQQDCGWCSNPEQEMQWLIANTGKYPAIRGMDMGDGRSSLANRATAWWNAGGIPMIGWHLGAPNSTDDYTGSQATVNINQVLTPGTSLYNTFINRLDQGAAVLQTLENARVPVIWRPFHEAGDGCAWFWWAKEGGAQYVRLWRFMYDYFTNTKGLNNLIWMVPYCGTPGSSFYPGKAWIDLAGGDTYGSGVHQDIFNRLTSFVGNTVPLALHENGPIPNPNTLQSSGPRWVMFNTWNNEHLWNNGASYVSSVYNHAYVITRDELPNLRTGGGTPTPTATPRPGGGCGTAPNGYPYCCSASSDPDGDGWGWENNQSCVVQTRPTATPTATPTARPRATPTSTGGQTIANGTYRIVARHSGKALDVFGNGTANGTNVIQWAYGGGNNQRWTVTHLGNGQYSIIGVGSAKALDVAGAGTANGSNVLVWTYGGANNQRWTITATSGGYYRVSPVHAPALALEVAGSSTTDGANVQVWTYSGANSHQWTFQAP